MTHHYAGDLAHSSMYIISSRPYSQYCTPLGFHLMVSARIRVMITRHNGIPSDKLLRLHTLLRQWGDKRTCTRKELESLVGLLNHECKVVRAGRSFLRRTVDLLHSGPHTRLARKDTPIRLNTGSHADLAWWQCFLQSWNGVSFLSTPPYLPRLHMASDA